MIETSNDLRTNGTIAVVGAGPGGLTLARILQRRGFAVRVYERDASPTARPQGGSLDLRPALGALAIRAAGLKSEFEHASRDEAKAFRMIDSQGEDLPGAGGETHEEPGPEIDRGDLRSLLLASVAEGTVSWDHTVADVRADADGRWRLEFANRPPVVADLVIGADGVGSKVRQRLTAVRPEYTGMTMIAGYIRTDLRRGSKVSEILGEGSVMFAEGAKTIFVQRCARNVILLYFSLTVPKTWPASAGFALSDSDAVLDVIRDTYRDWSPGVLDMLTQLEDRFEAWPISVMPPDYTWETRPGLTMLGDASHAMPPFTGKGVNLALYDALQLADALSSETASLSEAIGAFEAGMQARTKKEISECLGVGRRFYALDVAFPATATA